MPTCRSSMPSRKPRICGSTSSRRKSSERPRLAPREVLVLHWIAQGKSNEEIAMILGSKRPTIATHIKRIFTKLDVSDRASAAVKGLKFGIINI